MMTKEEVRYSNSSTMFLLPLFEIPMESFKRAGFINAYVEVEGESEWNDENVLFLLFEQGEEQKKHLRVIMSYLEKHVEDEIDYDGWTVVIVRFPPQYLREYKLFLMGKFSEYSEEAKAKFPSKPNEEDRAMGRKKSFVHLIFSKDHSWRMVLEEMLEADIPPDSELFGIPDLQYKEKLNINNFL